MEGVHTFIIYMITGKVKLTFQTEGASHLDGMGAGFIHEVYRPLQIEGFYTLISATHSPQGVCIPLVI